MMINNNVFQKRKMAKRQKISEDGLVFSHPMASNVSDQVIKEEEAAACRLGTFH